MKKAFQILASAAVLALSASAYADCTSAKNLVANCGFETGDFTGWTLSGLDVPGQATNLYGVEQGIDPLDGVNPNGGDFQAYFLDIVGRPTTLSQTFATTVSGTYTISFYVSQDITASGTGESSNLLKAMFGSTTLANLSDVAVSNGYVEYTYTTVASSASTTFSLTMDNGLGQFLLDDVSVTQVPEPASLGLVGIALVGAIGASRRRKA